MSMIMTGKEKKTFHCRASAALSITNLVMTGVVLSIWLFGVFGTTVNLWQKQSDRSHKGMLQKTVCMSWRKFLSCTKGSQGKQILQLLELH